MPEPTPVPPPPFDAEKIAAEMPNLSPESVAAVEEMLRWTYARLAPEPTPVPDAAEVRARTCWCSSELVRAIAEALHGPEWDGIEGVYGYCDVASSILAHGGPNGVTIRPDASLTPAPGGLTERERRFVDETRKMAGGLGRSSGPTRVRMLCDLIDRLSASPAPLPDGFEEALGADGRQVIGKPGALSISQALATRPLPDDEERT